MKRSLAAIIAASTLLAFSAPSHAASVDGDYRLLGVNGYWTTFYTTTHEGDPMCVMKSNYKYRDSNQPDGSLMVKYVKDSRTFLVHAFKWSWRIPNGVQIPIYMTFDNSRPFTATATGVAAKGLNYVAFAIAPEFSKDFLDLFAAANNMTLGFTEGSEPPWTANMSGSRESVSLFARCITAITGAGASSSTQPHGNGPTQPYGGGATQPFSSAPSSPLKRGGRWMITFVFERRTKPGKPDYPLVWNMFNAQIDFKNKIAERDEWNNTASVAVEFESRYPH
jgi:hypothetical protein